MRPAPALGLAPVATVLSGIDGLELALKDGASVTADGDALQERIVGVEVRRPPTHADGRGTLTEIYATRAGASPRTRSSTSTT